MPVARGHGVSSVVRVPPPASRVFYKKELVILDSRIVVGAPKTNAKKKWYLAFAFRVVLKEVGVLLAWVVSERDGTNSVRCGNGKEKPRRGLHAPQKKLRLAVGSDRILGKYRSRSTGSRMCFVSIFLFIIYRSDAISLRTANGWRDRR